MGTFVLSIKHENRGLEFVRASVGAAGQFQPDGKEW